MSDVWAGLSDEAKYAAILMGYLGACVVLTYVMYKWFAVLVGKSVVAELVKAGIITVL